MTAAHRRAGPRRRRGLVLGLVLAALLVAAGCGGEDLGGEPLAQDAAVVLPLAAEAMGEVTSVRFDLERTGGLVYIDTVGSLSLDEVTGRYAAPNSADAVLTVTIDENLSTKLGAVSIDGDTWLSNPVTGKFEPLGPGYDIDPSMFFDPVNGWRPLLQSLREPDFIGQEKRDGTRYHIQAIAPAAEIEVVTAGLVSDQDVVVDLWLHPVTALVTALEFTTEVGDEPTNWVLELGRYGDDIRIEPPVDG